MEYKANKKSILALSFEIYALLKKSSHSTNFDIGRLWSRRPMESRSSHSVLKSSHQKYFFTDIVKFHFGPLAGQNANRKSILALSFEIFALGHSQIFKKIFLRT
jgi:hypothetical protein